jgi:predicted metal-dependent phosphoesterase TrpH
MNIKKANFHVHTYWSDGIYSPKSILKYASRHGIKVMSFTDHNEIRGTLKGFDLAGRYGIEFFPGIELYFNIGESLYEVLAIFENKKDIRSFYKVYRNSENFIPNFRNLREVVNLIKIHNGVAIAPHPYGRKGIYRGTHGKLDFPGCGYEKVNAFTGSLRNNKAKKFLPDQGTLTFGAADMHSIKYALNKAYTQLSSKEDITRQAIWDTLNGKNNKVKFSAKGESFQPQMIWIQKFFCGVKIPFYLSRQYVEYLVFRTKHFKRLRAEERARNI